MYLQIGVLHQVEYDIRFRIIGIETFVPGLVIVLEQDDGILPADHIHVHGIQVPVLARVLSEDVDRVAVRGCLLALY